MALPDSDPPRFLNWLSCMVYLMWSLEKGLAPSPLDDFRLDEKLSDFCEEFLTLLFRRLEVSEFSTMLLYCSWKLAMKRGTCFETGD